MIRTILGLVLLAACAIPAFADGVSEGNLMLQVQLTDDGSASYGGNLTLIAGIGSGTALSTQVLATLPFDVLAEPNPPQTFTYTSDDLPVGTSTIFASIEGSDQFGNAIYGYPSGQTPVPPPPATPSLFTVYTIGGPASQTSAVSIGDSDPYEIGELTTIGALTPVSTTPEPGTIGLTVIGVGLLMMLARKRVFPAIRF